MRSRMLRAMQMGDPLTFMDSQTDEPKQAWLNLPHDGSLAHAVKVTLQNGTVMDVMPDSIRFKREPSSPVGPSPKIRGGPFDCDPCGHGWDEHDDSGCLWMACQCFLPGERK